MHEAAERLVEAVERGELTRREAVRRLVAVAAAAFAGGVAGAESSAAGTSRPTFQSVGLNHVALRVTDLDRSSAFYERHLGLKVLRRSPHNCFMGAGANNFVAMFRAREAGLDHYCYTIDDYRPAEVVERLKREGLEPSRHDDRVYFDDPDGIQLQLASEWGDYPGGRP